MKNRGQFINLEGMHDDEHGGGLVAKVLLQRCCAVQIMVTAPLQNDAALWKLTSNLEDCGLGLCLQSRNNL